ncbi:MAG: lipopolysaccharide biosynthesis protein [Prevotella sp.]|nr:lipopolysaccharide biosynthesis protein [Prevotella sp.]
MESLKEKTAKGLFWGALNNGVTQLLGALFGILLGRLLSPEDYSMMTMIAVFSQVAAIVQSSGFTTALVNLKEPEDNDYNSVFWFNIFVGIALYAILFLCAPLIASYYHTPELKWFCRYAFLGFLFANIGTAQGAWLQKNLRVKQQAKAGIAAVLLSSSIGVSMAWAGFSYWSLATQSIVYILTVALLRWHYSPWRPSLRVDFGPVRRMFPFSVKILGAGIVDAININLLNILLGRYFTKHDTGCYNQAYQWQSKCNYVVQGMVNSVAQPVLAQLNDDSGRQLNAMRKLVRFTAFISFPLLFGLSLVSREFIVLLITEKWLFSATLLRFLCISGAFYPIVWVFNNMIISKGRSSLNLLSTTLFGLCQIAIMVVVHRYGIFSMVISYVVLNIFWVFVLWFMVNRLTGYRLLSFLKDILPFLLAAAGVMAATWLVTAPITSLWLLLLSRVVLAIVLYYMVMRLARVKMLDECQQFLLAKLRKEK